MFVIILILLLWFLIIFFKQSDTSAHIINFVYIISGFDFLSIFFYQIFFIISYLPISINFKLF